MSATGRLVRLYPAPFRDRWGAALEADAESAGPRGWPDLVRGILDMWLHPTMWPADIPARRWRRASVLAATVAVGCWFVAHLATETYPPLGPAGRSPAMNGAALLMLTGLALIAPWPHRSWRAATMVVRRAVRRFTLPAGLGGSVLAWVHLDGPLGSPWLRAALFLAWYAALAGGGVQSCRFVADLDATVAVPPRPRRLQLGLCALLAATAVSAGALGAASISGRTVDPLPALIGIGLLLLGTIALGTLRDLRRLASG